MKNVLLNYLLAIAIGLTLALIFLTELSK